jgi:small-conductance mechanosensitive channel
MSQRSNRAWLSVAALALGSSVGITALPLAGAEPPPTEAPAPEEPKEITSADFAIQANAVEDRLSQIRTEISVLDVTEEVNKALDEIEAQGEELQAQFRALETRRMMISELNALDVQLELLHGRIDRQIEKLSVYAGDLEALAAQTEEDIEVWKRALRATRGPSVPKSVRDRAASILHGVREGRKELNKKVGEVLDLQSRTLDVRDSVHNAEQAVTFAQREQANSLFQRQDPPLWRLEARPEDEAARQGYDVRFSWPAVTHYLQAERGVLLFQLFVFLALGWGFVRSRRSLAARSEKRQQEGSIPWEDRAAEALRHPWAAALMLTIASVRFVSPERVVDMILLTWVVALPVWFVVFKEMVPAAFRNALIGIGSLATLHIVVTMVSGHPGVERALLLVELGLASAGAGWAIRFLQDVDVPKRLRQGLWFALTSMWTRFVLLISGVGVAAAVLGYMYLAAETAMIAIIGTIAATASMAAARIVEALVVSAVYAGRLDALRMIRANRDTTTKVLGRGIRLAATILFLWSLADMTSAWRPIGSALGGSLSADLGLGLAETGVTFGDLFAFFIILWLGWVLARLVSFVLREELLPRLHMKTGVPFALTTFTRYMIIAIGFMAAVSVLGIPLDRLTIMLSALGVGIGFGLQGLVNNVVSGFVLLTERPIRLRDKIEIEGVLGHVSNIGIRASTIRTFDGAEVIVPNGDLISQRVVNWTLSARRQRVTIPVGVAYGTDPNQVLDILRKLAAANEKVFKDPEPLALFRGFGESSLDFELRIFMDPSDVLDVPSAVTVAINEALNEAGIEIPFPQRDLHLRGVPGGFAFTGAGAGAGAGTDTDTGTGAGAGAGADTDTDK